MFPGDDATFIAFAAEPAGTDWRWQTWHLYPRCPLRSRRDGGPHREPVASMSRNRLFVIACTLIVVTTVSLISESSCRTRKLARILHHAITNIPMMSMEFAASATDHPPK